MYQFGFHLHLNSTKGAGVEKFILGPGGKIRKSMNYVIRCTNFNMTGLKNKWYFFFYFPTEETDNIERSLFSSTGKI